MIVEGIIAALVVIGGFFTAVGSFGLARLPDFFMRLHGPTKATTLGVGSLLIASTLLFIHMGEGVKLHKFAITGFLFLTAPVSAHLLSKAAIQLGLPTSTPPPDAQEEK